MAFVGRRRTRDSVDSKVRPRVSSTLSQLFSKARRVSVEPPRPPASDGIPFPPWLAHHTSDPITSSPTPSFEIRRPSGLGPRSSSFGSVSSLGSICHAVVVDVGYKIPDHYRHPSISEPNLLDLIDGHTDIRRLLAFESQAPSTCETRSDSVSMLSTTSYALTYDIPSQIWENVTRFLPSQDLASLARVSSAILPHVREVMYGHVNLQFLFPTATRLCVESLASHPELAILVRTFKSPILPSFNDQQGPLPSLSFAIALCNMKNLTSLSLPGFDKDIFRYTTFRLQHLSLTCETMSASAQVHFSSWLATQHGITSLSLPVLTTELRYSPCVPVQRPPYPDRIDLGPLSFPTPPSHSFSIPNLRKFDGPPSLVQSLVPGRPVSEVVIYVNRTLYDGLKPSQLMGSVARSTSHVERLSIRSSPSPVIDARTMERLLMSAGAEFGLSLLHLEVTWATDDESLYRNMLSIIPRFPNLKTLNYVPASVPSTTASSAAIDQDSLSSPAASTPLLLSPARKSSPESTPRLRSVPPTSSDRDASDAARARERQFIKSWVKVCPSLTTITFLSGAEWCVIRRKRRISVKNEAPMNLADGLSMCVPSFVRWRHA